MALYTDPVTNFCVGNPLTLPRYAQECPNPITSAVLNIYQYRGLTSSLLVGPYSISTTLSAFGQITNSGVLQTDGTYLAQLVFLLSATDTQRLAPGANNWTVIEVGPGPYVSEIFSLFPLPGGDHG